MRFHRMVSWYKNLYIPKRWRLNVFSLTDNLRDTLNLRMVCVLLNFPVILEFTFPMLLRAYLFGRWFVFFNTFL